jgi:photosynthetic reaction center H subunit
MYESDLIGNLDIAHLTFLVFLAFFTGLVLYLRREDRREGYPLEDDVSGRHEPTPGFFFMARPKAFRLAHGGQTISKPDGRRDVAVATARRTGPWSGAPYEPQGDAMAAGVGPGAYARRAQVPDMMHDGKPKIVPMRVATAFSIEKNDPDPRGMIVVGADGAAAGRVSDVWVDRAEVMIRYLEIELDGAAGRRVLAPMTMAVVQRGGRRIRIDAVLGGQFAGVPALANPDQVTLDEEERVCAYFGAGYLYATAARAEPLL